MSHLSPVRSALRLLAAGLALTFTLLVLPAVASAQALYGGGPLPGGGEPPEVDDGQPSDEREGVVPAARSGQSQAQAAEVSAGGLAFTGTDVTGMVVIGGVALIGGSALLVVSRRRRATLPA